MSIDESQVTAAVAAVTDPELRRPLGELGMVGPVQAKRKRVAVEVALPVAHYPQVDLLEARVHQAVSAVAGVDEVAVDTAVMDEEPRARLRMLLRGEAVEGGTQHAPDDGHGHGHDHGGGGQLGHEEGRPNRFMLPRSKTRILGISSGKGGVGKSSVTVNLAVALARQGLRRGHPRRRRLRLLGAQDARCDQRPADHRRPGGPAHGQRRPLPVHGLLRPRRHPGDLAGAHAPQGARAVPGRRLLGRARLPADRHAPGHR